jgi:hypothetical protein
MEFAKVAEQYSQGHRARYGGVWRALNPESLREEYQPVIKALIKLEAGGVTEIIETEKHYFIGKLINFKSQQMREFAEVQDEIREKLRQQEWEKYSTKISRDLMQKSTIGDVEGFVKQVLEQAYAQFGAKKQEGVADDS